MERLEALISKLQEQFKQQADLNKLSVTAQMILTELEFLRKKSVNGNYNKVSVVVPGTKHISDITIDDKPETFAAQNEPKKEFDVLHYSDEEAEKEQDSQVKQNIPKPAETFFIPAYSNLHEIPTLAQHSKESIVQHAMPADEPTLNDKLKEEKKELAASLKEAPIKDLKKAIGINDRYLFINELFRGDETMYERSIKTINSFNILAEAEFWIQRELKLKLGWKEDDETVALFDQLVRRRFS